MKNKAAKLFAISLVLLFTVGLAVPTILQARPSQFPDETTYLNGHNFSEQYWSTEVDWIELLQAGITALDASEIIPDMSLSEMLPPELNNLSINTYHAYVNQWNYWMFYTGFEYTSFDNGTSDFNGTMPMQTIVQSYRTTSGLEVYSVQTYIMTAFFNDSVSADGIFTDGEELYVTIGFSLDLPGFSTMFTDNSSLAQSIFETPVIVTTDPITAVDGGYTWGMKYENIKLLIFGHDENSPDTQGELLALMVLSELSFNYVLGLNQATGEVTINTEYTIGAPSSMVMGNGTILNNTAPDYELTQWIADSSIKMAIANMQLTTVIDTTGQGVTTTDNVSTAITNTTEDWDVSAAWFDNYVGEERIFSVQFGSKRTYTTEHPNGTATGTHNAITRIYNALLGKGLLENPFFAISTIIINLPSAIAVLYNQNNIIAGIRALFGIIFPFIPDGETILSEINTVVPLSIEADVNYYVIYYPEWDGEKVVHDPTFVAFADLSIILSPEILAPIVIVGVIAVVVIAMVVIRRRRA